MQFFIPGKTFLVGEYLALHNGPALVVLTGPSFRASFFSSPGSVYLEAADFHAESPAGKYIRQNPEAFQSIKIVFEDRVLLGGLGASTAQFLAVYSWHQKLKGRIPQEVSIKEMLSAYLSCAFDGQGTPPSGADLVGQLKGGLCYFDKSLMDQYEGLAVQKRVWPFNARLYLLHTGYKLATHEHLKLGLEFDSRELRRAFDKTFEGLNEKDLELFCDGINEYAAALSSLGFTCENSLNILNQVRQQDGVLASKACGAMGADVIAVVCNEKNSLMNWAPKNGFKLLATDWDICEGLVYES